jgi:hypothetical protein
MYVVVLLGVAVTDCPCVDDKVDVGVQAYVLAPCTESAALSPKHMAVSPLKVKVIGSSALRFTCITESQPDALINVKWYMPSVVAIPPSGIDAVSPKQMVMAV